jgi:methylmalonyl-CoA/ethylmalonyl-CoA epimerase
MPLESSTENRDGSAPQPAPRGTRIAHLGIAVSAIRDALPFYRDVLGMPEVALDDADGARIAGVVAGESLVELLEPAADDTPIGKFVSKRGPGIHHICFAVEDIDAMLERCRAAGVRLIDQTPRIGAEGKRIAFLHPSSTGGVLVELSEY